MGQAAGRIASFLGEVEGVNPVAPGTVLCVWETIVNYRNLKQLPKGHPRPERSVPPPEQQQEMVPPVEEIQTGFKKRRMKARNDKNDNNNDVQKWKGNGDIKNGKRNDAEQRASRRKLGIRGGKTHADPSSLRVGHKHRPYTAQNLADMLTLFQRLERKYSYDEEFVRIMRLYIESVSNTVPMEIPLQ